MKKRLLSMLLVLVMVLGMFPMSAMAVEEDTSWYSESENAFEISTAA